MQLNEKALGCSDYLFILSETAITAHCDRNSCLDSSESKLLLVYKARLVHFCLLGNYKDSNYRRCVDYRLIMKTVIRLLILEGYFESESLRLNDNAHNSLSLVLSGQVKATDTSFSPLRPYLNLLPLADG